MPYPVRLGVKQADGDKSETSIIARPNMEKEGNALLARPCERYSLRRKRNHYCKKVPVQVCVTLNQRVRKYACIEGFWFRVRNSTGIRGSKGAGC